MNDKDVENFLSSWQTTSYRTRTQLHEVTRLVKQSVGPNIYQEKQGKLQKSNPLPGWQIHNISVTVILSQLLQTDHHCQTFDIWSSSGFSHYLSSMTRQGTSQVFQRSLKLVTMMWQRQKLCSHVPYYALVWSELQSQLTWSKTTWKSSFPHNLQYSPTLILYFSIFQVQLHHFSVSYPFDRLLDFSLPIS